MAYCCKDFKDNCNHNVTIGFLKSFISYIQKSDGSTATLPTTGNFADDAYCPTYAELTGGTLIPNAVIQASDTCWSNNVDGVIIASTFTDKDGNTVNYSGGSEVKKESLTLAYTRLNSFSVYNNNPTVDPCGGSSTTSYTTKFTKYTQECGQELVSEVGGVDTCVAGKVSWLGTDSSASATKTFTQNGVYDAACNETATTRTATVSAILTWRGSNTDSSNFITVSQGPDTFDHYTYYPSETGYYSGTTAVHVNVSPWDFRDYCLGEQTAYATAYYDSDIWRDREKVSKCGVHYCRENKYTTGTTTGSVTPSWTSYTVNVCDLTSGAEYKVYATAEKDGFSDSDYAVWSCKNCAGCPDTSAFTYVNATIDECGEWSMTATCVVSHYRMLENGDCVFDYSDPGYSMTDNGQVDPNPTQAAIPNVEIHSDLFDITVRVTQDAGPCGGCTGETYYYTIDDVTVGCDAAAATSVTTGYTLITKYGNCADETSRGTTTVAIPARECNAYSSRVIRNGSSASTLANAVAKITQNGGCACCSVSTAYTFADIALDCTGLTTATSFNVAYTAVTTNIACETAETYGTSAYTVAAQSCNATSSIVTIQNGSTGALGTAKPKITQAAGPCCECTAWEYRVSSCPTSPISIGKCGIGRTELTAVVQKRCTTPFVGEWENITDYTYDITYDSSNSDSDFVSFEGSDWRYYTVGENCTAATRSATYKIDIKVNGTKVGSTCTVVFNQAAGKCETCECENFAYSATCSTRQSPYFDACGGQANFDVEVFRRCLDFAGTSPEHMYTGFTVTWEPNGDTWASISNFLTISDSASTSPVITALNNCTTTSRDTSIYCRVFVSGVQKAVCSIYVSQEAGPCIDCPCSAHTYSLSGGCPDNVTRTDCNGEAGSWDIKVVDRCTNPNKGTTAYTNDYTVVWTKNSGNYDISLNGLDYVMPKNCTNSANSATYTASFRGPNNVEFSSCTVVFSQAAGPCSCNCTTYETAATLSTTSYTFNNCGGNYTFPIQVYKRCVSPYTETPGELLTCGTDYYIDAQVHTPSNPSIYSGWNSGLTYTNLGCGQFSVTANCNTDKYYKELTLTVKKTSDNTTIQSFIVVLYQSAGKCDDGTCGCLNYEYSAETCPTDVYVAGCGIGQTMLNPVVKRRCTSPASSTWQNTDDYTVTWSRVSGTTNLVTTGGTGAKYYSIGSKCTTTTEQELWNVTLKNNGNNIPGGSCQVKFVQSGMCEDCQCQTFAYSAVCNNTNVYMSSCPDSDVLSGIHIYSKCVSPFSTSWSLVNSYRVSAATRTYDGGVVAAITTGLYSDGGNVPFSVTSMLCLNETTNNSTYRLYFANSGGTSTLKDINGNDLYLDFNIYQGPGKCQDCVCEKYEYFVSCDISPVTNVAACGGSGAATVSLSRRCSGTSEPLSAVTDFSAVWSVSQSESFVTLSSTTNKSITLDIAPNCGSISRDALVEVKAYVGGVQVGDECSGWITQNAGPCQDGSCGCLSWAISAECPGNFTIEGCDESTHSISISATEYCTVGGSSSHAYNNISLTWSSKADSFLTFSNNGFSYAATKNCTGAQRSESRTLTIKDGSGNTITSCTVTFTQAACNNCNCTAWTYSANCIANVTGLSECEGTYNIPAEVFYKCTAPNPDADYSNYNNYRIEWTLGNSTYNAGRDITFSNSGKTFTIADNCSSKVTRAAYYSYKIYNEYGVEITNHPTCSNFRIEQAGGCTDCPCASTTYSARTVTVSGTSYNTGSTINVTLDPCGGSLSLAAAVSGRCEFPYDGSWTTYSNYYLSLTNCSSTPSQTPIVTLGNDNRTLTYSKYCGTAATRSNCFTLHVKENSAASTDIATAVINFTQSNCSTCACSGYSYTFTCPSTTAYTITDKCIATGSVNTPTIYITCTAPPSSNSTAFTDYTVTWAYQNNTGVDLVTSTTGLSYTVSNNCTQSSRSGQYTLTFKNANNNDTIGTCSIKITQTGETQVCQNCEGVCYGYAYSAVCTTAVTVNNCGINEDGLTNCALYYKCTNPMASSWTRYTGVYTIDDLVKVSGTDDFVSYNVESYTGNSSGNDSWKYTVSRNCGGSRNSTYRLAFYDASYSSTLKTIEGTDLYIDVKFTQTGTCCNGSNPCPCTGYSYSAPSSLGLTNTTSIDECGSGGTLSLNISKWCAGPCSTSSNPETLSTYSLTWTRTGGTADIVTTSNNGKTWSIGSNCSSYRSGYYDVVLKDTSNNEVIKTYTVIFGQSGPCGTCACSGYNYTIKYNNVDGGPLFSAGSSIAGVNFDHYYRFATGACADSITLPITPRQKCTNPAASSYSNYTGNVTCTVTTTGTDFVSHTFSGRDINDVWTLILSVDDRCAASSSRGALYNITFKTSPGNETIYTESVYLEQPSGNCATACTCLEYDLYGISGTCPTSLTRIPACGGSYPINAYLTRRCAATGVYEMLDNTAYTINFVLDTTSTCGLIKSSNPLSVNTRPYLNGYSLEIGRNCDATPRQGYYTMQFKVGNRIVTSCTCVYLAQYSGPCVSGCCKCDQISASTTTVTFNSDGSMKNPSYITITGDNLAACGNNYRISAGTNVSYYEYDPGQGILTVLATPNNSFTNTKNVYWKIVTGSSDTACISFTGTVETKSCDCSAISCVWTPSEVIRYSGGTNVYLGTFSGNCQTTITFDKQAGQTYPSNISVSVAPNGYTGSVYGTLPSNTSPVPKTYYMDYKINGETCGNVAVTVPGAPCSCSNSGFYYELVSSVPAVGNTVIGNTTYTYIGSYSATCIPDDFTITVAQSINGGIPSVKSVIYDTNPNTFNSIYAALLDASYTGTYKVHVTSSCFTEQIINQENKVCTCQNVGPMPDLSSPIIVNYTGASNIIVVQTTQECGMFTPILNGDASRFITANTSSGVNKEIRLDVNANNTFDPIYAQVGYRKTLPNGDVCQEGYRDIILCAHTCSCTDLTSAGDILMGQNTSGTTCVAAPNLDSTCSANTSVEIVNMNGPQMTATIVPNGLNCNGFRVSVFANTDEWYKPASCDLNVIVGNTVCEELINVSKTVTLCGALTLSTNSVSIGAASGSTSYIPYSLPSGYSVVFTTVPSQFTVTTSNNRIVIVSTSTQSGTFYLYYGVAYGNASGSCGSITITKEACSCSNLTVTTSEISFTGTNAHANSTIERSYSSSCGIPSAAITGTGASAFTVTVNNSSKKFIVKTATDNAANATLVIYMNGSQCTTIPLSKTLYCSCGGLAITGGSSTFVTVPPKSGDSVTIGYTLENPSCSGSSNLVVSITGAQASSFSYTIQRSTKRITVYSRTNNAAIATLLIKDGFGTTCYSITLSKAQCALTVTPNDGGSSDCEGGTVTFSIT